MPELPEVETTRRGITPFLQDQTICQLEVFEGRLRWPVPADLPNLLKGQRVLDVSRRGKYLLIHCTDGTLLIHLGMSGSLRLVPKDSPRLKHDHIELRLASATCLRYNDPRRFGAWLWSSQPILAHPLLAKLGPEPFGEDFTPDHLYAATRSRNTAIKALIMDSHIVVGVGNIYANEALFLAGIHPGRPAQGIARQRITRLHACILQVLTAAVEQGGTSLRDFVSPAGKPGYFKQSLNVYGRAGEACPRCAKNLTALRIAQRNSVFCSHCQH